MAERHVGRQGRWENDVKMYLTKVGCQTETWMGLAKDRIQRH
jgi:hypothetical protein